MNKPILFFALAIGCGADKDSSAPPDFAQVRDELLVPGCGNSTCHGTGTGGLTITSEMTRDDLVGVASVGAPTQQLVAAGDVEGSYLAAKMRGDAGIVGGTMPPGSGATAEQLQLVEDWIAAGAP